VPARRYKSGIFGKRLAGTAIALSGQQGPIKETRKDRELVYSILVVDDEVNMLVMLDRILTKEGYAVHTDPDGNRALELIAQHKFSLAVVDIKMHPMDGLTLLGKIKESSRSTQVIMMTGYSAADSHDRAMENGAEAYLTKPLNIPTFKDLVRELCSAS
jgi:CheY-like chemotaxis protein